MSEVRNKIVYERTFGCDQRETELDFFKDGKTDFIQATAAVERLQCKLRYLC